jgi:sulfur carrier protein
MYVNGKEMDLHGITLESLLDHLKICKERVVVEINYTIVDKNKFKDLLINKEDRIEIVSFVGGG